MNDSTKNTPVLQAPSFEEANGILRIHTIIYDRLNLIDKQIALINKRLDILDQVVLNIPKEEKL